MSDKIADSHARYDAIYGQDNPRTPSGGWIQWKGTNVCMDLTCECGWSGHHDGDFFYYMRCPSCKRVYAVGQNIKLIALTPEQAAECTNIDEPQL